MKMMAAIPSIARIPWVAPSQKAAPVKTNAIIVSIKVLTSCYQTTVSL